MSSANASPTSLDCRPTVWRLRPGAFRPRPISNATIRPRVVANLTAMNTEGVRAAYASAQSHQYQAFGDARQIYRPQIGFGSTYSRFSEINNYQEYYLRFQHNNFEAGLQITLPLFDAGSRAKETGVRRRGRSRHRAGRSGPRPEQRKHRPAAEEPERTRRTKRSGAVAERTRAEPA